MTVALLTPSQVAELPLHVRLLDVRPKEALIGPTGHIPGAYWVPMERLASVREALRPEDPVVTVGAKLEDGYLAGLYLEGLGMKRVSTLSGGIDAWRAASFSTSRRTIVYERKLSHEREAPAGEMTRELVAKHVGDPARVRWVRLGALLLNGKRSCVDGRDDSGVVGTPGGDLGEFCMALSAVEVVTGHAFSDAEVVGLLQKELDTFGRFYLHTDDHAASHLEAALAADPRLARFKSEDPAKREALWRAPPVEARRYVKEHALLPEHFGCGHMKLMLTKPEQYGVRPELVRATVGAFYELLWGGAAELELQRLDGHHEERAVVAIVVDEELWDLSPIPFISPSVGGQQVFIAHPQVAQAHRDLYVEFFRRLEPMKSAKPGAVEALAAELARRGGEHLSLTVAALAKGLPFYEVHFSEGAEGLRVIEKGRVGA